MHCSRITCLLWAMSVVRLMVSAQTQLPTVTVRGFLNFRTTVDGTAIVFVTAAPAGPPEPPPPHNSLDAPIEVGYLKTQGASLGDKDNAAASSLAHAENDLEKIETSPPSNDRYPTGLVTVLGDTSVEGRSTTLFETKVIGTYIDGKYAQILQSTSHVVDVVLPSPSVDFAEPEATISTNTIAEIVSKDRVEESSTQTVVSLLHSETESITSSPVLQSSSANAIITATPVIKSNKISQLTNNVEPESIRKGMFSYETKSNKAVSSSKFELSSRPILISSMVTPSITFTLDHEQPTESLENARRSIFLKKSSPLQPVTSTILNDDVPVTSKHQRGSSSSRTRFVSLRRPSQSVRLNRFKVKLTVRQNSTDDFSSTSSPDDEEAEDESTHRTEDDLEMTSTSTEGLNVDPAKVVFQETTITSEVTLHVGRRKSVRTLTITTSVPLTIHPSDIQDILMSESSGPKNINHHVVTRTFTTTERALKTSIVPVFDGKSTTFHSVTESFFIMKIVTAYRTLPPGDASYLEEADTTLEAAANIQPSIIQSLPVEQVAPTEVLQRSLMTGHPHMTHPYGPLGHNPLAAVYLGLQQLNAQMTLFSTVTDTTTFLTTETIYSTKTIRLYDGRSTKFRTVSEPISTRKATVTSTVTSIQPYLNTLAIHQQQQLQKLIGANRMSQQPVQYNTVTSTYTTVTTATSLSTRVYTLIYNGFSTKFRTVTSTTTYPTTATITSTVKVPLAATQVNVPLSYP